jgi:hypothetical protein
MLLCMLYGALWSRAAEQSRAYSVFMQAALLCQGAVLLSSRIPEAWRIVYIIVRYARNKDSGSFGNFSGE